MLHATSHSGAGAAARSGGVPPFAAAAPGSAAIPSRWRKLHRGLVAAAMFAVCAFVAVQSWQIVVLFAGAGQVSIAAGVP